MRYLALLLPLVLISSHSSAEDEQERVRELEKRVAALERENEVLKRKIAWLERLRVFVDGTKTQTAVIRVGGEPDREYLKGITLPENATKEQVREYVARILRAASHKGSYGATDPEVDLLKQVGSAHVDVLIEPLVHVPILNPDIYLLEAIKSLVREEHKDLVLRTLPVVRRLVQVVQAQGWTEEAAPILLEVLADRDSWSHSTLPTEWVEAVANLRRPEDYQSLKTYFYYGHNRYHTWKAIKDLPGMELEVEVEKLWRWAKELDDNWVRISLAAVAAHYGHLDALEVLFEDPGGWPEWEVIEIVTPYRGRRGEAEQAKKWFKAHKSRLWFNVAEGKYRLLRERETAGEGSD